jgi:hypothetical protein
MSIGDSGRVVIEVDTTLKHGLHKVLKEDGLSMKEWFVKNAESYLAMRAQLTLDIESKEHSGEVQS